MKRSRSNRSGSTGGSGARGGPLARRGPMAGPAAELAAFDVHRPPVVIRELVEGVSPIERRVAWLVGQGLAGLAASLLALHRGQQRIDEGLAAMGGLAADSGQ